MERSVILSGLVLICLINLRRLEVKEDVKRHVTN